MKRILAVLLPALLLAGCTTAEDDAPERIPDDVQNAVVDTPATPDAVKTGLAVVGSITKSMNATLDSPGAARTEVTFVALTVDADGIIRSCCIDGISAVIPFDATGALQLENDTGFASKNELGYDYAMHKASTLGTDWDQQAAAFAAYAVGKRAEELDAGDVTTSVTISTDAFLQAIRTAAETATHQGALLGDKLKLVSLSHMDESHSASLDDGTDGCAAFRADIAAVTLRDGIITSCCFDALETSLPVTPQGVIPTELSTPQLSMTALSRSSGLYDGVYQARDWCRQAAAFAAGSTGKTAEEVRSSAVAVSTSSSTATFHALLSKAVQKNG